jgi:hypothetical protein
LEACYLNVSDTAERMPVVGPDLGPTELTTTEARGHLRLARWAVDDALAHPVVVGAILQVELVDLAPEALLGDALLLEKGESGPEDDHQAVDPLVDVFDPVAVNGPVRGGSAAGQGGGPGAVCWPMAYPR